MGIDVRKSLLLTVISLFTAPLSAQVNVTTYHNDISRSGANTQESILTPTNVNSAQFGKLFSVAVDGAVYAQPLYLSQVAIGGGTHNVVYVATEHDSVYAIDGDSGAVYWQVSVLPAGGTPVNSLGDIGCGDLVPEIGVTGTPVIDVSTGTLYLVAKSKVNGSVVQYLHAIDVATAAEKFGGPVRIQATRPGSAADGNGSSVSFSPLTQNQRAALLLENGHVVIGWSSHCDQSPWHGWVMSYSASTLAQEAAYNSSANGYANGVWMSGGGLAADAAGNIYFATGNGSWNGTTDLGDSIVKLGPPAGGTFPVLDYFTPYNQATLSGNDTDVASGGLVLMPTLPSGQQLLVQMGKEGKIYVIDRNNMGGNCAAKTPACTGGDPQIVQEIPNASTGVWGSPAYWNGALYWAPGSDFAGVTQATADQVKSFSFNTTTGAVSTSSVSASPQAFPFPSPIPSISANGNTNGILWGMDESAWTASCVGGTNCQVLYAYDASNVSRMLYNSNQAANNADVPGGALKFATPTIANGKVYVGSQQNISVYGLLNASRAVTGVSVNLAPVANVTAFVNNGTAPANGGLDGQGYSYSANFAGSSAQWNGTAFNLGAANVPSAVSSATIALPAGNYAALNLLATGVFGAQANQTFIVTYTDGTSSTFTQSLSDWGYPQGFAGETAAVNTSYRVQPGGAPQVGPWYLYGYSFALNASKTVQSLVLPNSRNVIVMAASLSQAAPAVTPQPGFTLIPGTSTLNLAQNYGGTDTINVNPVNGFTGAVTFSVSGLPAGVFGGFSGNTLVIFPPLSTPVGNYPLTITGTSGGTTATTPITLVIAPGATFKVSPASASLTLAQGASGSDAVSVTALNGFTGTVSFSASGFPAGTSGSLSPGSSASSATLSVTTTSAAVPGSYPITITGTSGGTGNSNPITVTSTVTLVITAATTPGFTLTPAASTLTLAQNSGGTDAISVTPVNGFSGAVTLAVSGAPAGVGTAFSGNLLVVFPPLSTPTGTYPLTITGTSGAVTAKAAVTLVISAGANFSLSAASGTVTLPHGRAGTDAVTVNGVNGFNAAVSFAVSGLPAGVTGTFSAASSASGSVLTLVTATTTKPGTYPLIVSGTAPATGNSNSITQSTTVSLVVN
jgi:hypothetical protein